MFFSVVERKSLNSSSRLMRGGGKVEVPSYKECGGGRMETSVLA